MESKRKIILSSHSRGPGNPLQRSYAHLKFFIPLASFSPAIYNPKDLTNLMSN